jgi:hypothetical protein
MLVLCDAAVSITTTKRTYAVMTHTITQGNNTPVVKDKLGHGNETERHFYYLPSSIEVVVMAIIIVTKTER